METNKGTIYRKLILPVFLSVLVVIVLTDVAIYRTGILESTKNSELKLIEEKVSGRVSQLERQFEAASSLDVFVRRTCDKTQEYLTQNGTSYHDICNDKELASDYMDFMYSDISSIFGSDAVTGVFYILCSDKEDAFPVKTHHYQGIYLRAGKTGPCLERGNTSIADTKHLAKTPTWQEDFFYNPNQDMKSLLYFMNPLAEANNYPNREMNELAYWRDAFYLNENDEQPVLTYAQPIWDENRNMLGVIGVEVSVDKLYSIIKDMEYNKRHEVKYYLVSCDDSLQAGDIECELKLLLSDGDFEAKQQKVHLIRSDFSENIYDVNNLTWDGEKICGQIRGISMYHSKSVLAGSPVALLAVRKVEGMFDGQKKLVNIAAVTLLGGLLFGAIVVMLIGNYIRNRLLDLQRRMMKTGLLDTYMISSKDFRELEKLEKAIDDMRERYRMSLSQEKKEKERYLCALEKSVDSVFEYNNRTDSFTIFYFMFNKENNTDVTTFTIEHFLRDMSDEGYCPKEDISEMTNFLRGRFVEDIEVRLRSSKYEEYVWMSIRGRAFCDDNGEVEGVIGNIRDINEQKEKELRINIENSIDKNTGLLIYEAGEQKIREYLVNKNKEEEFSLCMIDLDDFSKVNDYYGFMYGDIIIEEVGRTLNRYLNNDDIGVRVGGDEFILLLHDVSIDETHRICESICNNIDDINVGEGDITNISCSIGFVHRSGFVDYANLIRYAGSAMHVVKKLEQCRIGEYFELRKNDAGNISSYEFDFENEVSEIKGVSYNTSITALTYNLFEKCGRFKSALHIVMKKVGFTYELSRILIIGFDWEREEQYILEQWQMFGLEPLDFGRMRCKKKDIDDFISYFENGRQLILERKNAGDIPEHMKKRLHYNGRQNVLLYSMNSGNEQIGFIRFDMALDKDEWPAGEIEVLNRVANIIAIQYVQNKFEKKTILQVDRATVVEKAVREMTSSIQLLKQSENLTEEEKNSLTRIEELSKEVNTIICDSEK